MSIPTVNEHELLRSRAATHAPASARQSTAGHRLWLAFGSTVRAGEKKQAVRQIRKAEVGHGW